jgi:hypothetical protein
VDLPGPALSAPLEVVRATANSVQMPVACPPTAEGGCRGTVRLFVRRVARRSTAAAARTVVLARGRFFVAAGKSKIVKVPLTRAGRRLLRTRRAVTVTAVVAKRGGPNIGQSRERTTLRIKRKRRRARATWSQA